jgi:thiol-disulfide isomerase/thioredoxin
MERVMLRTGACLLALAFLGTACRQSETPDAHDHSDSEPGTLRLFRDPAPVPRFTVTDLDGNTTASDEWRGKVVYVNFWATWCPPCRAEIPDLVALQDKYRVKIVVVGVSDDEGPTATVRQFAESYHVNYPIVMNTPELRKIFKGIVALPTTFVIDPEGRLVQKHVGQLQPKRTEAEARFLAGLDTNVKVERVDDSDKVRLANAAEAKTIPGLDLTTLNETQRKAAVQELIASDCTCGCGLTLAVCRLDDPDCPVSLPLARAVVAKHAPR